MAVQRRSQAPARPARYVGRRRKAAPIITPAQQMARTRRGAQRVRKAGETTGGLVSKLNRGNHALMTEFVAIMVIIILRALADYVPAEDESQPGDTTTPKGLEPLPLAAAAIATWFLLALVASMGRRASQAAVAFGALILLALLFNSNAELAKTGTWISSIGNWNPEAPKAQQTTPLPAGSSSGGGTPAPGGNPVTKNPKGGQWWVVASGSSAGDIVQSPARPTKYGSARLIGPLKTEQNAQDWIDNNLVMKPPEH